MIRLCPILILHFSEAAGGDAWASQTKMLYLTEEEFNEYKTEGYFRGIKYRWTSQDGSYTVYISKSSYENMRQNMESTGYSESLFPATLSKFYYKSISQHNFEERWFNDHDEAMKVNSFENYFNIILEPAI